VGTRSVFENRDGLWALLLGLAFFVIYAAGACPTIYVGDSGELVAAVDVLGIPHPTGYPLYVLLGKLWTLLVPLGSVAYRMSLFSAATAAAACAVLYWLCRSLALHPVAALTAAGLLGFGESFWGEANVQRVYSLNALFVVLATAAAVHWCQRRSTRLLALSFLFCGLGATNHTFLGVYAVILGAFVVLNEPRILIDPRRLAVIAVSMIVGLLPYLYLPIRSRMNPPLDWGNPETLDAFIGVVTRRGFWERAWMESPADVFPIAADYLLDLGRDLTWVGVVLAALGLATNLRRRWPLLAAVVMAANLGIMALHGSRSDIFIWHRYYIPSHVMAALLAALGCHWTLERLPSALRLAPLAIPAFLLVTNWRSADRSDYRIAEEFSTGVLQSLPPGANLIATDDNILFVLIYLTMAEEMRPDVHLILQGVGSAYLPPLHFNPDSEPLYFTHHPNWNMPQLDIVPLGIVFRAMRAGSPLPAPTIPFTELPGENDPRVPKDYLTENLIGHLHYMLGFTFEQRDWVRTRQEFALAAEKSPHNDVLFYNLGLIYQRNGMLDDAIAAFERCEEINPRHLASQSRPRAADRIGELRAERARVQSMIAAIEREERPQEPPGSPAHHMHVAQILEDRGEALAARGQRLLALEKEAHLR
jgi:tetratricopeptide (TPR) repeat protein